MTFPAVAKPHFDLKGLAPNNQFTRLEMAYPRFIMTRVNEIYIYDVSETDTSNYCIVTYYCAQPNVM